ncbi:MAG: dipeptide epimerase, partial [Campylobacterota bacterium]|nr:dipeptide epimerase [Campylobacterota bacterium]
VKYIPLKTPFITALRRVENIEFVRVSVSCENGLVAFGEAPATKAITGEDIEMILDSIERVKELFADKTAQESLDVLHTQAQIGSSAKAALDMAFISLLSQERKVPLYRFFGAKEPISLETDITISLKDIDEMLKDSHTAFNDEMKILKVKLGSDIKHSIEVIQKISKELPNAEILVDANQAWSLDDSLRFVNAVKDVKIELIEQPVVADDLEALKTITDATHIPILADEAAFNLEDVKRVVQTQSADMINIKLMKCGGLTNAVKILEYAREQGVTCMLGSMLEGPISINAALHLAMAYSDVIKYIDLDSPLLYKTPSDELDFIFNGAKIVYNHLS